VKIILFRLLAEDFPYGMTIINEFGQGSGTLNKFIPCSCSRWYGRCSKSHVQLCIFNTEGILEIPYKDTWFHVGIAV